jgi:hypothetical protein
MRTRRLYGLACLWIGLSATGVQAQAIGVICRTPVGTCGLVVPHSAMRPDGSPCRCPTSPVWGAARIVGWVNAGGFPGSGVPGGGFPGSDNSGGGRTTQVPSRTIDSSDRCFNGLGDCSAYQ